MRQRRKGKKESKVNEAPVAPLLPADPAEEELIEREIRLRMLLQEGFRPEA